MSRDRLVLEGTIPTGRIEFYEPVDLPEGTRVTIEVSTSDQVFE